MSSTTTDAPTCVRCQKALPKDVTFCAACGFDNGEFVRMGKRATFDEKIENRLWWFKLQQWFPFLRLFR